MCWTDAAAQVPSALFVQSGLQHGSRTAYGDVMARVERPLPSPQGFGGNTHPSSSKDRVTTGTVATLGPQQASLRVDICPETWLRRRGGTGGPQPGATCVDGGTEHGRVDSTGGRGACAGGWR